MDPEIILRKVQGLRDLTWLGLTEKTGTKGVIKLEVEVGLGDACLSQGPDDSEWTLRSWQQPNDEGTEVCVAHEKNRDKVRGA